eukprot:CAMPEP_0174842882 /NCGR_PEP_ID=MMETSP1114-20130205/10179_1 /TAXON_ID=312471 /ORGANISM="Neobodo designis, Strain CCAP 1951/1" /LENGTH=82 /DNA_ID=CAMNT_0016077093 /DNA_START=417 /DNA_END=662 /DNA_ORIENTATION=-
MTQVGALVRAIGCDDSRGGLEHDVDDVSGDGAGDANESVCGVRNEGRGVYQAGNNRSIEPAGHHDASAGGFAGDGCRLDAIR